MSIWPVTLSAKLKWFALLFFILVVLAFVPIPTGIAYFRLAGKSEGMIPPPEEYIPAKSTDEFLIHDGILYLKSRSQANSLLVMWGFPTSWDVSKLKAFRSSHPELEGQWPVPSADNGGVSWIGSQ
jgi:hypothetical protein